MAMTLRRAIAATTLIAVVLALTSSQAAQVTAGESRYQVTGLVLSVDPARLTFVASIDRIPGFMEAMTMPFKARQANDLAGIAPGTAVAFTLVVERGGSYVDGIRVGRSQNLEQDPLAARRLSLLRQMSGPASRPLAVGDLVPDVELIDQHSRRVSLGAARGKVIGINFMYTTCQLPDFCLRLVNHFSVLQQRLPEALGRDLELLTVTFDPLRDTPDALAEVRPAMASLRRLALSDGRRGVGATPARCVRRRHVSQRRSDGPLAAYRFHRSIGPACGRC